MHDMGEWWQVASPIVSALGVLVALGIAVWGTRQRRADDSRAQAAEARLVRILSVGSSTVGGSEMRMEWKVGNYGPQAIYDIRCEAWMWMNAQYFEINSPTWKQLLPVLPAGTEKQISTEYGAVSETLGRRLITWRILWSDFHGNRWVVNGRDQEQDMAHQYRPGELPPQHQGPAIPG